MCLAALLPSVVERNSYDDFFNGVFAAMLRLIAKWQVGGLGHYAGYPPAWAQQIVTSVFRKGTIN